MGSKAPLIASLALSLALASGCADPIIESTTVLADTQDAVGPYNVASVGIGLDRRDRFELHYQTAESQGVVILRAVDDDGDHPGELHVGGIPGQPIGSEITYYVDIERSGDVVARDPEGEGGFVFVITP